MFFVICTYKNLIALILTFKKKSPNQMHKLFLCSFLKTKQQQQVCTHERNTQNQTNIIMV